MVSVNDEGMPKSCSVIRKVSNGYEPSVRWKGILVDLDFCESDHFSKSFCVDGICKRGCSDVGRKNKNKLYSSENTEPTHHLQWPA